MKICGGAMKNFGKIIIFCSIIFIMLAIASVDNIDKKSVDMNFKNDSYHLDNYFGEYNHVSNTTGYVDEIGTYRYKGNIENRYRRLHNNIWGATSIERDLRKIKIYVYYRFDDKFGWEWNRPDPRPNSSTYISPIYPEVIIGNPFGERYSTTSYFPIQLKNITNWNIDLEYRYTKLPTGKFNLAYDIWFFDKLGPNDKKAEVMIWPYGYLGTPIKYVSDGINEYGLYYRAPNGGQYWPYYTFVLKNQNSISTSTVYHKVNIKRLLDSISGNLNGSWIVPGIELGNEVGRGYGRIEISKYIININGKYT